MISIAELSLSAEFYSEPFKYLTWNTGHASIPDLKYQITYTFYSPHLFCNMYTTQIDIFESTIIYTCIFTYDFCIYTLT